MKTPLTTLFVLLLTTVLVFGQKKNDHLSARSKIYREMKKSMVDELLKPWYPTSFDNDFGGFLSTFTFDFKPKGNQDKMLVTQARHTWSNATAAELFPSVLYYKKGAELGFRFLSDKMWDKEFGGFYTYTDRQGNPKASGFSPKGFRWLEKHSHDTIYKGYYQHMERDGTPIKRTADVPSTAELGYKDQNTSIHLLESFTELYGVWPDSLLKARMREMLYLVRDVITNNKGDLQLFFQPDWTPVSFRDSSRSVILKHHFLDYVSFGHNIETAYLMLEASHVLGLKKDTLTERVAKKMVDDALVNGWDNKTGGFYDEGYYFKDTIGISITADTKNWWAQAEGLNSLLMMARKYPDDPLHYEQKFEKQWEYVQTYLIDHEHGDWYQAGLDKQPNEKTALKGQIWKGTYHNFRALINCLNQLNPDNVPPTVPAKITLYKKGSSKVLKWSPSTDNLGILGYNIYRGTRRAGFTPLTQWHLPDGFRAHGKLFIRSVDLQGNESGAGKGINY